MGRGPLAPPRPAGVDQTKDGYFDLAPPYDFAQPSMVVVQWKEDGTVGVVYPFEYANTEFTLPSWVPEK